MIVNYKEAGVLFAFVTSTEKQSHIYTKKHDHQAVKRLMTVFRSGFFFLISRLLIVNMEVLEIARGH